MGPLRNAARPLAIPTYDGSGECVHPDVVEIPGMLTNARFLMAYEPYPFSERKFENPSLVVSGDGLVWRVPAGVTNPVVKRPPGTGWYSDGALAVAPDGRLNLYFRFNSGLGETTLLRSTSTDGASWSSPEELLHFPVSGRFASPSVVRDRGGLLMLYVDTIAEEVLGVVSRDGRRWSQPEHVLSFPRAWHVAARVAGGCLYLLLNATKHLYLLRRGPDQDCHFRDPRGWLPLSGNDAAPILSPSLRGWDSRQVYRGTFLVRGSWIRIWYSALAANGKWRIGYTAGRLD